MGPMCACTHICVINPLISVFSSPDSGWSSIGANRKSERGMSLPNFRSGVHFEEAGIRNAIASFRGR